MIKGEDTDDRSGRHQLPGELCYITEEVQPGLVSISINWYYQVFLSWRFKVYPSAAWGVCFIVSFKTSGGFRCGGVGSIASPRANGSELSLESGAQRTQGGHTHQLPPARSSLPWSRASTSRRWVSRPGGSVTLLILNHKRPDGSIM